MTDLAAAASAPAEPLQPGKDLLARVVGVFVSPRATYADVAARPRWLGVAGRSARWSSSRRVLRSALDRGRQAGGARSADAGHRVVRREAERSGATSGWKPASRTPAIRPRPARWSASRCVMLIIAGILLRDLQRAARRRRDVQAGLRHRRALGADHGAADAFSLPARLPARNDVEPDQPRRCSCRFSTKTRFWRGCSVRSICFRSGGTLSLAIGLGVLYKRRTAPIATDHVARATSSSWRPSPPSDLPFRRTGSIDVREEYSHHPRRRAASAARRRRRQLLLRPRQRPDGHDRADQDARPRGHRVGLGQDSAQAARQHQRRDRRAASSTSP